MKDVLSRCYLHAARFVLNFLLLLLLVNGVLALLYRPVAKGFTVDFGVLRHIDQSKMVIRQAYTGVASRDVDGTLREFNAWADLGLPYEPWVEYGERPFEGQYLNITQTGDGFRYRKTAPPPSQGQPLNVYLLGGSTAFGWDVADSWTIASYLQTALQTRYAGRSVRVWNFGRPGYFSSQELALLTRLVKRRDKPDLVLFLDGFNDCFTLIQQPDAPTVTPALEAMVERSQSAKFDMTPYSWIPMVRFALQTRSRHDPSPLPAPPDEDRIVHTYLDNVRMERQICRQFGIQAYFFWQPVSFYHYDAHKWSLQMAPSLLFPEMPQACDRILSTHVAYSLAETPAGFGLERPVYIDMCHYNPDFSHYLAEIMASQVNRN